jgi:hypothetical protein
MQRIQKFFMACCSGRQTDEKVSSARIEAILPEIRVESCENCIKKVEEEKQSEMEFNLIKLVPCFEEDEEICRANTKCSVNSMDMILEANWFKCTECSALATGFCVACPNRRFCFPCFKEKHLDSTNLHKFFLYKSKRHR